MRTGHLASSVGLFLSLGFIPAAFAQTTCPANTVWNATYSLCVCDPTKFSDGKCVTPIGGFGNTTANSIGSNQYLYSTNPSCIDVDANIKNSCAYKRYLAGQTPWTGASTTASNILTKMAEGASSLSSYNSTLTSVLSAYSTQLCGGGKVKACVRNTGTHSDNYVFRAIHDSQFRNFIAKLKDERGTNGFSTLITNSVTAVNNSANTVNQNFLTGVGTGFLQQSGADLKNLPRHLTYCSSDLLNSKVKSGTALSAAAVINILKDDPAYKIKCDKDEGAFTSKLKCISETRILLGYGMQIWEQAWRIRQCPAGGTTSLEDNQSDLIDTNSTMFATLQTCIGSDTLDKVQISASSSLLNNTAAAAATHCKKGFSTLSKARAASVKTIAKQKFGLQDGQFPDPPGPSTGGTNGDGTSGPCPYEIDMAKSSGGVFFEKAVAQKPDLKDYKYVKAVGTIVPTTSDRGRGADNLVAYRPCRAVSLGCEWAELYCPSDGTKFNY